MHETGESMPTIATATLRMSRIILYRAGPRARRCAARLMNRRAHSIHIFVKLAEPLDVPDRYVVHMYSMLTAYYTGRAIRSYVSEQQLDATRIFSGSTLCRFVHRTVHHTFPIDDAVNLVRDLWSTLPALIPV